MIVVDQQLLALARSDACGSPFVTLLEFGLASGEFLRFAHYSRDIEYAGETYTAWAFESQLAFGSRGNKVPTVTFTIQDQTRFLRPYAIANQWFRNCTLMTTVVNVDHLTAESELARLTYDILSAKPSDEAISLTLGGTNVTKMRFPADRYWAWQCPYARGFTDDPRCGYSGEQTACNGTPSRCEELDNLEAFGGFMGLDAEASRLVLPAALRGLA